MARYGRQSQRFQKLDVITEHIKDALEIAREEDTERDLEMRKLLKSAIETIDVVTGGFYAGHYEDGF